MAGITEIQVGSNVPIMLTLTDGNENMYPQAIVKDVIGATITTLDLQHSSDGVYLPASVYNMPNQNYITVVYVIYADAGHATESSVYLRDVDVFVKIEGMLVLGIMTGAPLVLDINNLPNWSQTFEVRLPNLNGTTIQIAEITSAGNFMVLRVRDSAFTVMSSGAGTAGIGYVNFTYIFNPPAQPDDWLPDDVLVVQASGITVTRNGKVINIAITSIATQMIGDDSKENVDAIRAKTDNLPTDPASETNVSAVGTAILADHILMKQKATGSYDRETDSLEAIRDKLDTEITGLDDIEAKIDDIQEDIGDPSSRVIYKSIQEMLEVMIDLSPGVGAIKIVGVVINKVDEIPQTNIRVRAYDIDTKLPLAEIFTNADGEWYLYLDPGDYIFEFAGESNVIDGFIEQEINGTVDPSPAEQSFEDVSLEPTSIDQGSGSETVGWNGSTWTFGTSVVTIEGVPAENVRIRAWIQGDELTFANLKGEHYTDEDGRYTLYLNPETYIFKFWRSGIEESSEIITVT